MTLEIDKEKTTKFISEIRNNVKLLQQIQARGKDAFLNDEILQNAALHLLQISIEGVISIGNHVISRLGLKNPKDFADVFKILQDANILPQESSQIYQKMARFRNRIVHLYWDVDLNEVYNIVENNLGDFDRFISEISDRFFKSPESNS